LLWPPLKNAASILRQCCQIFLGAIYQSGENIPNDYKISNTISHKISSMVVKYPT
jgi:hypothetical protein